MVEDNVVNQKVVTAALAKRNFESVVAVDGQQALTILSSDPNPFGLILMDIQMPRMDGLEATRRIRLEPRWRDIPIIAMTAHAMKGDREKCLQAGMNGYITKPLHPAELVRIIENSLRAAADGGDPGHGFRDSFQPVPGGAGSDLLDGMLDVFLQLAPDRLRRIEDAIAIQDATALAQEATKLSAAAERIFAVDVKRWADRIAMAAGVGDFTEAAASLTELSLQTAALGERRSQIAADAENASYCER